jgi:peptidoglycan/LPS O-acetylase OafA/YrhL
MSRRLTQLDGMRGLAALFVFTSHLNLALPPPSPLASWQHTPLGLFWGGQAAVDFFFVLSGFVLALPFMTSAPTAPAPHFYGRFVLQRLARIYPAYWFALLFSLVAMRLFVPAGVTAAGPWTHDFWLHGWADLSPQILLRHVLLVPDFDSRLIDPVSWTLVVEMRMSLLLPLIILAFRRWGGHIGTPLLLVIVLALSRKLEILHFLPLFALGVALARHFRAWSRPRADNGSLAFWLLLLVGLLSYGSPYVMHMGHPRDDYLSAVGAAVLIVLALQPTAFGSFLNSRAVQFLGRVSYSFYLLHLPTFLLSLSWLLPHLGSVTAVFCITLPLVCAFSWLSFSCIERPALLAVRGLLYAPRPALPPEPL